MSLDLGIFSQGSLIGESIEAMSLQLAGRNREIVLRFKRRTNGCSRLGSDGDFLPGFMPGLAWNFE